MHSVITPVLLGSGARARTYAVRLFLSYGVRPHMLTRRASLLDRLFPFWQGHFFSESLPDSVLLEALLQYCEPTAERVSMLYLCDGSLTEFASDYRAELERAFVLLFDRDGAPSLPAREIPTAPSQPKEDMP